MKKFISITLASIILLSNISVAFATHMCGGKAVASSFVFGSDAIGCIGSEMDLVDESQSSVPSFKSNCCQNIKTELSADDTLSSTSSIQLHVVPVIFVAANYIFTCNVIALLQQVKVIYRPPPLKVNSLISILFQVFRL
jgi:hypothetical protein